MARRRLLALFKTPLFVVTCAVVCLACTFGQVEKSRADPPQHSIELTPQMSSAVGDGRADDTQAIEAWMSKRGRHVCDGVFRITRQVRIDLPPSASLFIEGTGAQGCKIVESTPEAGIVIHAARPDLYTAAQIVLRDFTLQPSARMTADALWIEYPNAKGAAGTAPLVQIQNVNIRPANAAAYARTCIHLTRVRNSTLDSINCEGDRVYGWLPGTSGIVTDGDDFPTELHLRDVKIYNVETCFDFSGQWQGMYVSYPGCFLARTFLKATNILNEANILSVDHSDTAVLETGIDATNIGGVRINDGQVAMFDVGRTSNPIAVCVKLTYTATPEVQAAFADIHDFQCDGFQRSAKGQTAGTSLTRIGIAIHDRTTGFDMASEAHDNRFNGLDVAHDIHARGVWIGHEIYKNVARPLADLDAAPSRKTP